MVSAGRRVYGRSTMLQTLNAAVERFNAGDLAEAVRLATLVSGELRADQAVAAALDAIGSSAIEQALAQELAGHMMDAVLETATALVAPATACAAWGHAAALRLGADDASDALRAVCFAVEFAHDDPRVLAVFAECAARIDAPDVAAAVAIVARARSADEPLRARFDELIDRARHSRLERDAVSDDATSWTADAETWRAASPARYIFSKVMAAAGAGPTWTALYDLAFFLGARGATDLAIALLDVITWAVPDFGKVELAHDEWLQKTEQYEKMLQRRRDVMGRAMGAHYPILADADSAWTVQAGISGDIDAAMTSLKSHGFVLLKGAIDPSIIDETAAMLFTKDPDRYFVQPADDIPTDLLSRLVAPLPRLVIQRLGLVGPDGATSHGRQVLPSQKQHKDALASEYHQDALVFFQPLLNFWIALDPCGEDAPGLALLRDATRTVFPTRHRKEFSPDSGVIDDKHIQDLLQNYKETVPIIDIGDVLLFIGTVPHRTYINQNMTKGRRSIELRFVPRDWLMQPMNLGPST